jgi:imidazole glycerol-phosphate synthase subunit HisH
MIAIIDCGIGNLRSVQKALEAVGAIAFITDEPARVDAANAVILPGVGAYGDAVASVKAKHLDESISAAVAAGKPFLGVCVGLQMFFQTSEESPDEGLRGLIPGRVVRLPGSVKVPEMGWNTLDIKRPECPLLAGTPDGARFYFAHSYCADPQGMEADTIAATTTYGIEFCSVVWRDNVYGTQFHPEKSGQHGLRILRNFASL